MTQGIKPDKMLTNGEYRQLRPISERELVLLNFIRNQLNRCCREGGEVQVVLRVSEWGINWQIVK